MNTPSSPLRTHQGAPAKHISPADQLRRSVMSCMLWEREAYESGVSIAQRIASLIPCVDAGVVAALAMEARTKMHLRHVPLFIVREMARHKSHRHMVAYTLERMIQRADELAEFCAIWQIGETKPLSRSLSAQAKKGLAAAFRKFNEYQFAKYNRDGKVKLRDVLRLCHAKPLNKEQDVVFQKIIRGTLATPDTWEVALSAGADKKTTFMRLIEDHKLGGLALLRNLRNMIDAAVPVGFLRNAVQDMKTERILPFRFIAASKYAPMLIPELETAMFRCLEGTFQMMGETILLVDISGSMGDLVAAKSDLTRYDAACALAMLVTEQFPSLRVFSFSENTVEVPRYQGFALRDAIMSSQMKAGTRLGNAVKFANGLGYKRLIVITDEQSADRVPDPLPGTKAYMINVASAKNGVGYHAWTHIDGWSEKIIDYIQELEDSKL